MRILGLDYGKRRIGVALSDPLGITAQGLEVINYNAISQALIRIGAVCRDFGVEKIVLGMPLKMNGTRGTAAEEAVAFKVKLEQAVALPVILIDERLTTKAAEKALLTDNMRRKRRKAIRDMLAAVLILRTYLESGNH